MRTSVLSPGLQPIDLSFAVRPKKRDGSRDSPTGSVEDDGNRPVLSEHEAEYGPPGGVSASRKPLLIGHSGAYCAAQLPEKEGCFFQRPERRTHPRSQSLGLSLCDIELFARLSCNALTLCSG